MRLKKVKGADEIIAKGKYYLRNPEEFKGKYDKLFSNSNSLYIEIGTGKGDFIIQSAIRFPKINFIGIEKMDSVIVRAIQKSNELELNNLYFIRADAKEILNYFSDEVSVIYLNFSDPWPKRGHERRRLTSIDFLKIYDRILISKGRIIMKTDNVNFFNYSKKSLENNGYEIVEFSNNFECMNPDNIMTEYEQRFYNLGISINKLVAVKTNQEELKKHVENKF